MAAEPGSNYEGVIRWLSKAGLSRYVPRFLAEKVTDAEFKLLAEADYKRVGIEAAADKQKLTKLIRSLNPASSRPVSRGDIDTAGLRDDASSSAGLTDLSDGDDLLAEARTPGQQYWQHSLTAVQPGFTLDDSLPRIRVLVRKRPLNAKERGRRDEDVVVVQSPSLTVHEPRTKVDLTRYTECHSFTFDEVLDEDATNDEVYASAVEPLIGAVFQRGKATCFAYGQTGSGKTHTMQPLPVRAARQMLDTLASNPALSNLRLGVSFFEIYGGKVFDLLSDRRKLCIRENGAGEICVVGLHEYPVRDVSAVSAFIERGNAARSTGSTGANADSSRSHAILQLTLRHRVAGESAGGPTEEGSAQASPQGRMHGKFSFIDLAGSERGADTTDNDRQTRLEGAEINKSLLALKECIRALDQDRAAGGAGRHIPFRGSKLTEVLRDSFGGDGRTVMIANISPASSNCEHTLNTLRYADRVKELRGAGMMPGRISSSEDMAGQAQVQAQVQPPRMAVSPERRPVARHSSSSASSGPGGHSRTSITGADAGIRPSTRPSMARRGSASELAPGRSPPVQVPSRLQQPPLASGRASNGSAAPAVRAPAVAPSLMDAGDEEDALLAAAHDELMHTILEEEEAVISAHRKQIEDTMESVRAEMTLLQEVDRPGSAIDDYVSGLTSILAARAASVAELQARLATFQRHLKEEEILSRTVSVSKRLSLDPPVR